MWHTTVNQNNLEVRIRASIARYDSDMCEKVGVDS